MFLQNLPITTEKSPPRKDNNTYPRDVDTPAGFPVNTPKLHSLLVRPSFAALLLASLCLTGWMTGCKDPTPLDGGFLDPGPGLEIRTVPVESVEPYSVESYAGRHRVMGIGRYDDPLFGEYLSIGVIKPAIDTLKTGSRIEEEVPFRLRLVFSSEIYGDPASTASFNLYPVTEPWRGAELRFGQSLPYDETRPVGSFTAGAALDTILVDLDREWVEEYNQFLSMKESERDSLYRDQFHGLAIVPDASVSKVIFPLVRPLTGETDDDTKFVRFVAGDEGGGDEDGRKFQSVLDWGALQFRSEPATEAQGLIAHSTLDRTLQIHPGLDEERLGSRNLASAMLVLNENLDLMEQSLPPGHKRPEISRMSIHIVSWGSVNDAVFTRPPDFTAESDEGSFRFDITSWVNSLLFDQQPEGNLYLTAGTAGGIPFSTLLYDASAPDEEKRPKILITAVKSDLE